MKTRILTTFLLLAVPSAQAPASPPPVTEQRAVALRDAALRDEVAYGIVRDVTTRFGPRLGGSANERAAAEWAAGRMRELGLQNVRIETFPVVGWERGEARGEIVGPPSQPLVLAALGGCGPTPAGGVEGEVVVFPTFADLQKAAPGSLAGKIAMVAFQMPRFESGAGYGVAVAARGAGPVEAAKKGAVAFLLRSSGTADQHRLPHTGATRFENGAVPIPGFALSGPDASQIERLAALGPVRVRLFSTSRVTGPATSQNVIGDVPGRDPAAGIIIIGGHLDSWDIGTGAMDDAAGVAISMSVGRMLAALPQKPLRTIRVILWGSEEISQPEPPFGIRGGFDYVARHRDELPRVVLAGEADIGADRVMSLSLPKGWQKTDFAASVGRVLLPLGILMDADPAQHGGADVSPMVEAGVPVFFFNQDASRYFDLHHTADDTFDKIDLAQLRQVTAAWVSFLWLASEAGVDFRKPPSLPPVPVP